MREIDELTAIAPRRAGSEAERRAARHIQSRLQELGREAELEPIRVRPAGALAHLVHAVAGIVASVLSVYVPAAGLIVAAAATISALGDLTGTFYLVRSLTPVRASQNVVSDEDSDKPGLVVLVAHYDAPITAMITHPRLKRWPVVFLASLAVVTICALGRLAGLDATWFTAIQFIPTVVLIASTPLFADAAIAETTKGVADNAGGVAAALRVAESHSAKLEHFDLLLLFTGGSAHAGLGMRGWLKRHRGELDPEATAVISIDKIGTGTTAYAVKEGPLVPARMHPTLLEVASTGGASSFVSRDLSDAYVARAASLPALRVSTTGAEADTVDPDALARVHDFVAGLLERIDEEIGSALG